MRHIVGLRNEEMSFTIGILQKALVYFLLNFITKFVVK